MWQSTNRPSTILIVRQDGTIYDLSKMGFGVVSFNPPSANWQHTWQQVGKYHASLTNSEVQQTTIPLVLDAFATDNYDMELQRLMLRQIFMSDEYFYVISMRTPYLRWKCVADAFDITQLDNYHKLKSVSISLLCIDGFAESTATTQTPFTYDSESWGIGENLPNGVNLDYTFTTPSFKVYNASIIPLRAEEHPVTIAFTGDVLRELKIENKTTSQTIILDHGLKSARYKHDYYAYSRSNDDQAEITFDENGLAGSGPIYVGHYSLIDENASAPAQSTAASSYVWSSYDGLTSFSNGTENFSEADSLILKGLVPIVNGSQDYGASNHAYLDLAVGWNEFEITGASNFTIIFDTRFYY